MKEIKCPHCGILAGEVEYEKITKHFICNECNSMFHSIIQDGEIKVELQG
jgi:Zn finger protein HypA/HybF involved in hydrogenase expression